MKSGSRLQWFGIGMLVVGVIVCSLHAWQRRELRHGREDVRTRLDGLESLVAQADSETMTTQEIHQMREQLDAVGSDLKALHQETDSPWSNLNVLFYAYASFSIIGSVLTILGARQLRRSRTTSLERTQDD